MTTGLSLVAGKEFRFKMVKPLFSCSGTKSIKTKIEVGKLTATINGRFR